ncbi:MAG TPA: cellulose binding domain-containing protein [Pseudonocardiaceae bacterium]|nr:cellulose binding domain-containing protein [Pseudonocardiaceae bacterium]
MDRPPRLPSSRTKRRGLLAALALACAATALYPAVHAASAATTPLTVQYKTGTGPSADEAEPWFKIVNGSGSAVALNQVTLRYYFSADTTGSYVFACAWAVVGCSNITGTVSALANPTSTADHYLQIAFTGGSIAAGADTGDIQLRLYRADWQNVNQANDYSYVNQTSYAADSHVTAYQNGNLVWGTEPAGTTPPTTTTTTGGGNPPPANGTMFDDFAYSGSADPNLGAHDWAVRTSAGGPGVSGATWSANAITFPGSSAAADGHVMQLSATTNGTSSGTTQAEIDTVQRKFFEGTYAARVYINDAPSTGPNGDDVNETFYTITPDEANYSELDNEYLPNGGWGAPGPTLYTTTWYSADAMDRQTHNVISSLQGWHTLEMTVSGGTVTYYVDGNVYFSTTGKYYPRDRMTIDFNEWFIDGGLVASSTPRTWNEQVDWVYFANGTAQSPSAVDAQVAAYRSAHTSFTDTVPNS